MKPRVTFIDPIAATCGILRDALTIAASNRRPPHHPDSPGVQVNIDGDRVTYPVLTEPLLRICVWGSSEDAGRVYDLAQDAQSYLLSYTGNDVAGYRSNTGVIAGADPDNGDEFAYFMVTARIKATVHN